MQENSKKYTLKEFGAHIKGLRNERKMTLSALCYKNGLEPSTVSRIEKGIVEPKYFTLRKLAKAFGVDLNKLFDC